uniref:Uncharacterized protein n=1 Tax=Setaria digitata TaxID=48799 RepID=A0A915PIR5_9BILA
MLHLTGKARLWQALDHAGEFPVTNLRKIPTKVDEPEKVKKPDDEIIDPSGTSNVAMMSNSRPETNSIPSSTDLIKNLIDPKETEVKSGEMDKVKEVEIEKQQEITDLESSDSEEIRDSSKCLLSVLDDEMTDLTSESSSIPDMSSNDSAITVSTTDTDIKDQKKQEFSKRSTKNDLKNRSDQMIKKNENKSALFNQMRDRTATNRIGMIGHKSKDTILSNKGYQLKNFASVKDSQPIITERLSEAVHDARHYPKYLSLHGKFKTIKKLATDVEQRRHPSDKKSETRKYKLDKKLSSMKSLSEEPSTGSENAPEACFFLTT